jgi:hypothetical protein
MFGLGGRRKADDEAKRLQALTQELQQASKAALAARSWF